MSKNQFLFRQHKNFFSKEEQELVNWQAPWVKWRRVPKWLGNFEFCIYTKKDNPLPTSLVQIASKLSNLVPEQKFNTVFFQKYEKGSFVKPHRDPKNNVGYTVIGVFGNFEGAQSHVGKQRLNLKAGDVLVQRCTIDNLIRPVHRVSKVTRGTRYAIILNTIKR